MGLEQESKQDIPKNDEGILKAILITGAHGVLGTAIQEVFKEEPLIAADKYALDVTRWYRIKEYMHGGIKLIIHLAAMTDVIGCQADPQAAYFVNHTGTMNMGLLADALNVPIVYISSGGVFYTDDPKREFFEYDLPNPRSHHHRSKLYGEYAVKPYSRHYIIRTGWIFGGSPAQDKKMVGATLQRIQERRRSLSVIEEATGNPTYAIDLARNIKYMLDNDLPYGLYHCAGIGMATRYDVAAAVIEHMHLEGKMCILSKNKDYNGFCNYRSMSECLVNNKLDRLCSNQMRPWREALKEYLQNVAI